MVQCHEIEMPTAVIEHAADLTQERGKTMIADSVVATIAAFAAREVEGVHRLVSTGLGQTIAGLARTMVKQQSRDVGVFVEVAQRNAAVDVRLSAEYGVNIPALAAAVRNNVINRVESLTGLTVTEVNVAVLDLHVPEAVALLGDSTTEPPPPTSR
jgi:uncharacterized alkaline shock family protein YloU